MAQGISIHVGINSVDPKAYDGWEGTLLACEFDAQDMAKLAKKQGFAESRSLMTADATVEAVTAALTDAATKLERGDTLLFTYSGHGGQVPDKNSDEADKLDETWVLFDRQLVDDELYAIWSRFAPGVRIAMLSDSCHSGTVLRRVIDTVRPEALRERIDVGGDIDEQNGMRAMPVGVRERVYKEHKKLYDGIQKSVPPGDKAEVKASVLLISGCQDNQTSADGTRNGLFTQTLRKVWNSGRFKGGYRSFHKKIVSQMPPWQTPNYVLIGEPNLGFERDRPFTL